MMWWKLTAKIVIDLTFSEAIEQSVSYSDLPNRIQIPDFVSSEAMHWRWLYY